MASSLIASNSTLTAARALLTAARALLIAVLLTLGIASATPAHAHTPAQRPAPEYVLPAPPPPLRPAHVAIGDSFIAGVGAGSYVDSDGCRQSRASFAALVARDARRPHVDLSCPGATAAWAMATVGSVPVDASLVLIQAGGNDINFTRLAISCLLIGDVACSQALDAAAARLPNVRANVADIARRARTQARDADVVVLGYPRLLDTPQVCAGLMPGPRVQAINSLQRRLDGVLQRAARDARVRFLDWPVSIDARNLCRPNPWYGLPGERMDDVLHPTAIAHRVMAHHITNRL